MSFIDKERLQNIPFLQDGDLSHGRRFRRLQRTWCKVEVKNVGGGKRSGIYKNMEPCRIPHLAKFIEKAWHSPDRDNLMTSQSHIQGVAQHGKYFALIYDGTLYPLRHSAPDRARNHAFVFIFILSQSMG